MTTPKAARSAAKFSQLFAVSKDVVLAMQDSFVHAKGSMEADNI